MRQLWLADLNYVNPGRESTILPFPLNVAYLGAYIAKMLPDQFAIRIFKDPAKLLRAISEDRPDVVAFSNYIWNKNLSLQFATHLKSVHPSTLTIMGGPNYNFTELDWVEAFSLQHRQIDFHIEGEGEAKLYNLLACYLEHDGSLGAIQAARPAGVAYVNGTFQANLALNTPGAWSCLQDLNIDFARHRLRDLNDIPSPYLTGLLDEFLADPDYCPIIETNRGCPYACTFCNWGAMGKSKSAMFSLDRVMDELDYISEHNVSTTPYLYIGDANFGLFPRDVEIANRLRELKDTKGFPRSVYMYFAKNSSDRVVQIAGTLKDMTAISLSRQTQNPEVLKHIKRSNISVDTFNSLAQLTDLGVQSYVELIHSLPGESKASFYDGVREIMRQKVDMLHIFPAMLLHGSEMGTEASRRQFGIRGKHRLIDGCAGIYGPVVAMEFEEIITETSVLSEADYFELRLFHFIQALFLDARLYRDVEVLLGDRDILDLMLDIISTAHAAPAPFAYLIADFIRSARDEFVEKVPEAFDAATVTEAVTQSVKLNPRFIARLLYDPGVREAFHFDLTSQIRTYGTATNKEIQAVLQYITAQVYPFDDVDEHVATMAFDAEAFANRPLGQPCIVGDYLLDEPRTFLYKKDRTFAKYTERYSDLTTAERVYEILVHHTRTMPRRTLTHELVGAAMETTTDQRVIRLEGGWLY